MKGYALKKKWSHAVVHSTPVPRRKILLITRKYLGDTVMTLPLIQQLEAHFGEAFYATEGYSTALLEYSGRPTLQRHYPSGILADFKYARFLRTQEFEVALLAKTSFRTAWLARIAKIPQRIGHGGECRAPLLTDPVDFGGASYFAFSLLDLLRPLGVPITLDRPSLPVADRGAMGLELLQGATVGIQAGATSGMKRLSRDQLTHLMAFFSDRCHRVAILGGPEESPFADQLREISPVPFVNLVGKTNLAGLCSTLSQLNLVVGGDTGLLHLASAVGATTVQVFGSTNYRGFGNAFGNNQVVVSQDGNVKSIPSSFLIKAAEEALDAG